MRIASGKSEPRNWRARRCQLRLSAFCFLATLLAPPARGQELSADAPAGADLIKAELIKEEQLNVNWLYGAYVPKEAPLVSLTAYQRGRLFERQTLTTPGIYLKSGFLALLSQARGEPYQWAAA